MPKSHQYQHEKMNPGRLLNWAKEIGESSLEFVKYELNLAKHPPNTYSKVCAILSLQKLYPKVELDLAIGYAKKYNITTVKSVKRILQKKLYLQEYNAVNNTTGRTTVLNSHDNLRGNIYS